jgi:fructan beta-fructosidase
VRTTKYLPLLFLLLACKGTTIDKKLPEIALEKHRPQLHFTPEAHWMNDPNGMVFYNNEYHLFYQYYPGSTVWGPMHWGHATSTDLIHWKHLPIALYPDSLGYIFSGSAVVDKDNTSGLGSSVNPPLVAIYTSHDSAGEAKGSLSFQNQSIAWSNDSGKTWKKYSGNPVLKNPGIKDFRDPKVSWYEAGKKWIMTLAVQDHIAFYSSKDLKNWSPESEFGKAVGEHGGVWECPDLFTLDTDGKKVWVLLVSINPGGPNGGSATQYFTGDFDGKTFTPFDSVTRWIDYGPDNYAGVTWCNTGDRKIFLGWMSNWDYARQVPTEKWRSAMTLPRDLTLKKTGHGYLISSIPVPELKTLEIEPAKEVPDGFESFDTMEGIDTRKPFRTSFIAKEAEDFSFELSNENGEKVIIGFDKKSNEYYIDRRISGNMDFSKLFPGKHTAPRLSDDSKQSITIIVDASSVELFADNGITVMTSLFFPSDLYNKSTFHLSDANSVDSLKVINLKSMYAE